MSVVVKNGRNFSFVVKKSVPVNNHGHVGTVASNFMALLAGIKKNDTQIPAIKHRKIISCLNEINEPCHEKTNILHMRKQRRRPTSR